MSDDNKETPKSPMTDEEREAKIKAAAEARAARLAAKQAAEGGSTEVSVKTTAAPTEEPPKEPSPNQPKLDLYVNLISEHVSADAIEQSFINERDLHMPYVIVKAEHWLATAELLRDTNELDFNYLRNLSGVDQETHLEVVYHLLSINKRHEVCVKVKADRESPSIASVTPIWPTADWNEREVYDLLGVDFPGHPDLRRIMMPDDWVGHPLRKDYEPLDPEV